MASSLAVMTVVSVRCPAGDQADLVDLENRMFTGHRFTICVGLPFYNTCFRPISLIL